MEGLMTQLSEFQVLQFFTRNAPVTKQQCLEAAERIAGQSAAPADVQGGSSYTLVSEASVIQFRDSDSPLDLKLLGYVERAHAGLIPHHESAGTLGNLHVYKMNNVKGVSMYLARDQLHSHGYYLLRQTMKDYAKFFASAWRNTPAEMPRPSGQELLANYSSKLSHLSNGLPRRFRPALDYLIQRLPELFESDWPLVPNHTDLLENNIYVDPGTGRMTGICDWKDTEISPFGMSFRGLETMLGVNKTKEGWCYHTNHEELRSLFWGAFKEASGLVSNDYRRRVEVASLVGLFLEHGFEYDEGGNWYAARDGTVDLAYLDVVILRTFSHLWES